MKLCGGCEKELPEECFGRHSRNPDGLQYVCKNCKSKQDKVYQNKHKDKIRDKKHEYYLSNKTKIVQDVNRWAKNNHGKRCLYASTARKKIKTCVLSHYCDDGLKCKMCGNDDLTILTIDHINGNGNKHRKEIGIGRTCGARFYFWLKRNNYPAGFQVLCFNCQFRKRLVEIRPENPTHLQQVRAKYARSIKVECLEHYGGLQCSCGEGDDDVLTLDHVNDDGARHREETGTRGQNFYHMLRKSGFPNDPPLQVMCLNCQIKKRQRKYEEGKNRSADGSDGSAVIV